jgi:hypothetical protein
MPTQAPIGINPRILALDRDFGAGAGIAGDSLDLDHPLIDFRALPG